MRIDRLRLLIEIGAERAARLDANLVRTQIIEAIFNILVDNCGGLHEGLLNIMTCLGRRLKEKQVVLAGKLLTFFGADLAFRTQVILVSNE